jgi:hypothetical protein
MKNIILLVALGLALPLTAFADSVDFTNSGGTLTQSGSTLSLTGSTLAGVIGLNGNGPVTGTLGTVTFTTGALNSGSFQLGGTFAAGGSFAIAGNGVNGVPDGVIFAGSFTSATWTLVTVNGDNTYTFSGVLAGSLEGSNTSGTTMQFTLSTGTAFFNGSIGISPGDTLVTAVPEPGSLCLVATGLLGLVGSLRRKISAGKRRGNVR